MKRQWVAVLLAMILCASLLTACSSTDAEYNSSMAAGAETQIAGSAEKTIEVETAALPANRKIVLNAEVEMESSDFDAVCQALRQTVQQMNGYMQSSRQKLPANEGGAQWAEYEFRIPADRYEAFLQSLENAGNVLNISENSEDITADYVDVEARIEALTTQQQRLMEMMAQAGDLDTLLAVQNQLAEVQYQLESYEGQKRVYDNQVAYSTVRVTVQEVLRLTTPVETFSQRVEAAFYESWYNFGITIQNIAVMLVYMIPLLLLLGIVALIVWACICAVRRHRAKHPHPRPSSPVPAYRPQGMEASPAGASGVYPQGTPVWNANAAAGTSVNNLTEQPTQTAEQGNAGTNAPVSVETPADDKGKGGEL